MINSEVFIIKRDGKKETFSLDKIKNAIAKAFLSVGSFATQDVITTVLSRVSVSDGMNVEEIQNQVEVALMAEHYYSVAKAYMLYRQKHLEDREVRDKLKFLLDYCDASNPATGSKYDANANVENKNIATLIGELPKSNFIRLNRRLLTDRLKDMYGKELSDRYLELLNHHFIYKNDETNLANYCASITMYPWLNNGTIAVGGNSTAPTNLKSFCGGFVNMVFIVSSMLSGACATPEFLMYMNYFIGLEYGQEYYKYPDKIVDLSTKQRTIDKIITDCFEQIVYSINQPTGARNFQAVFWNVAYYDKYYFESLFGNFFFPDGSQPDWNSLSWMVDKTLEDLWQSELVPFDMVLSGQFWGEPVMEPTPAVMVAHILLSQIDPDNPASLSPEVVTGLLREEMGYEGVVCTDDLTMGAISNTYGMGEAAVLAVEAGCDLLLVCHGADNLAEAHAALVEAVDSGCIPEERLDESVYRVLSLKTVYGLSNAPVEAPDIEALNDRIAALERSIEADTSQ